jgi:hypothetical protein
MATILKDNRTETTVETDIEELRRLLREEGLGPTIKYFTEVRARHGDVPELAEWNRVLGPNRVEVRKSDRPARDHLPSFNWIRAHASEY